MPRPALAIRGRGQQFFDQPRVTAELEQAYWKKSYSAAHGRWLLAHHHEIALDEKWRDGLSGEQREMILRHDGSQEAFQRLLALKVSPAGAEEAVTS